MQIIYPFATHALACVRKIRQEKKRVREKDDLDGPVNPPVRPVPPAVLLLFILTGFALEWLIPLGPGLSSAPRESVVAGLIIIACAIGVAVLAAREMSRVKTTVYPGQPASALVTSGVFSRSRNPIYLGFLLILLGTGIAAANPWMILLVPILLFYLQERVIKREENYLTKRFGEDYLAYKRRTRRWF
jgi:protein-S-isoprenylcysteine O-methyltransferase Ste14